MSELWICVASAIVHEIISRATTPILTSYFERISTVKGTNDIKTAKVDKSVTNFYKGVYFAFSSFFSWYLMSKGNFLPWFMGGSSSTNVLANMYDKYPLVERVEGLKELVLITGGYHIWGTY